MKKTEMFIFRYGGGLRERLSLDENSYNTKLINAKGGLNSIIKESKPMIGQNVVAVFDGTHDERVKSPIGGDMVNSTFRYGILMGITRSSVAADSIILFEDPVDGKKILTPIKTASLIEMVSAYDLTYPVKVDDPEASQFFFSFFYHRRGEKGFLHSNPLGAFVDGRSQVIRPGSECKQAYFQKFQSTSFGSVYSEGDPERSSAEYERRLRQGNLASQKTYLIRCGHNSK